MKPESAKVEKEPGRIIAIVVTYHPDVDMLRELLSGTSSQVDHILIVDNGSDDSRLSAVLTEGLADQLIQLEDNHGIAGGVNRGLEVASAAGYRWALLLDQDSLPDPDMVEILVRSMHALRDGGVHPAAAGPVIRDRVTGHRWSFVRYRLPGYRRLRGGDGAVRCDFIITSGTLLDMKVFDMVGGMDEGLFIDNVDLEWCFRARRMGYPVFGVFDTELEHSVGERRVLFERLGIHYAHHPPGRLYYMVRNGFLLYRRGSPFSWIVYDAMRLTSKLITYSMVRPRRKNMRAMWAGFLDGIRGRSGKTAPTEML